MFLLPPPYSVKRVPLSPIMGYDGPCSIWLTQGDSYLEGFMSDDIISRVTAIAAFRNLVQYEHPSIADAVEVIANSAIRRDSDGRVFRGHRHNDCIAIICASTGVKQVGSGYTQGFVTNRANRFVGREEAFGVAVRAGQIDEPVCPGAYKAWPELFSEDLW